MRRHLPLLSHVKSLSTDRTGCPGPVLILFLDYDIFFFGPEHVHHDPPPGQFCSASSTSISAHLHGRQVHTDPPGNWIFSCGTVPLPQRGRFLLPHRGLSIQASSRPRSRSQQLTGKPGGSARELGHRCDSSFLERPTSQQQQFGNQSKHWRAIIQSRFYLLKLESAWHWKLDKIWLRTVAGSVKSASRSEQHQRIIARPAENTGL